MSKTHLFVVLSGNPARFETAAKYAKLYDNPTIIVTTSFTEFRGDLSAAERTMPNREIVAMSKARDTVDNFTQIYDYVTGRAESSKHTNRQVVMHIVTDETHMRRASAIAKVIFFGHGIQIVEHEHIAAHQTAKRPWHTFVKNILQAVWWRTKHALTGGMA